MGIGTQLRGFIRAFRTGAGSKPGRHRGHAVARTLQDGATVSGRNATLGGMDSVLDGSERYDASFDED